MNVLIFNYFFGILHTIFFIIVNLKHSEISIFH